MILAPDWIWYIVGLYVLNVAAAATVRNIVMLRAWLSLRTFKKGLASALRGMDLTGKKAKDILK